MNLCVCVKVVPDRDNLAFDMETGTMNRGSGAGCLNPADLVALEIALGLAKKYGGGVDVVSMGPPGAAASLCGAFFLGAREVFLLASPAFAGADVPATAYTLSCFFAARPPYDIILCGKCSTDGNTGQLGAYLAELLNIVHLGGFAGVDDVQNGTLFARQRMDGCLLHVEAPLPCLLVAERDLQNPHTPTLADTLRAKGRAVQMLDDHTLPGLDPARCGLAGSATRLAHLAVPHSGHAPRMVTTAGMDILLPLFFPPNAGEARKPGGQK